MKKEQLRIQELEGQVRLLDRTIHETVAVLLNAMDKNDLVKHDLNAVISVAIGNLLYGSHIAEIDYETDD